MQRDPKPAIRKVSTKLYRKVEEVHHYRPTADEIKYWYSGTHAGLDPDNVYAPRHRYSTVTYYEEV